MKNIPRVDLNDFITTNTLKKNSFVNTIGNAFESIGFVILKGHFLSPEQTEQLYKAIRRFFALPEETKKSYEISGLGGQRGYTSFGKESAKV